MDAGETQRNATETYMNIRRYTVENNRRMNVQESTRTNMVWGFLRGVKAGDRLTIVRKNGKPKVWVVDTVIGVRFRDTILSVHHGKETLTFSWRNAAEIGVKAVCFATANEIKASEKKPARKPAAKVVKAIAKVAKGKRAATRKGKAAATVNPYIAAMRRIAAIARGA